MERLECLADGRLLYRFKRPWRDGTTHVVYEPLELLEKLSALVPAPRAHLVRYAGVLVPASPCRSMIVPAAAATAGGDSAADTADVTDVSIWLPHPMMAPVEPVGVPALPCASLRHGRNYSWAELMRRVWELDVLECPRCHGRMTIVAAIHSSESIVRIRDSLGLPSRAPPVAPACRTAQSKFDDC